jgi:hypothetical protein
MTRCVGKTFRALASPSNNGIEQTNGELNSTTPFAAHPERSTGVS